MQPKTSIWPKRIRVERKIVNLLSRSLYLDFPRAIREMVSNSYDADATVIRINVDLGRGEIVVEDNGNGISSDQFDRYLEIAGAPIEGGRLSPRFQRTRIGRFGVGFLATFPFCERLEISSKRQGSDTGFVATIATARFVKGAGAEEEVSSIPVNGYDSAKLGPTHTHFTRIRMVGLTQLVDEYFHKEPSRRYSTIESWTGMERLRWQLCEDIPLDFSSANSPSAKALGTESVGMDVLLNGQKLFRNDPPGQLIETHDGECVKVANLAFRYAITTNWRIVHPVQARGLKIRLHGIGVGPRTYLDYEKQVGYRSRLNWLTGEVHVLEGLDEALALSRDAFTWSPEYEALKDHIHKVLTRTALWVETVAVAEKTMADQFDSRGTLPPMSSREVASQNISALQNAGFTVVHKNLNEAGRSDAPVLIDKTNRIVTVIDDHSALSDVVELPGWGMRVRYRAFEETTSRKLQAARLSKDGVIEINTAYPLFSKGYKGDIFRRLHFVLFMAQRECKSASQMYDYLVEHIREEFG